MLGCGKNTRNGEKKGKNWKKTSWLKVSTTQPGGTPCLSVVGTDPLLPSCCCLFHGSTGVPRRPQAQHPLPDGFPGLTAGEWGSGNVGMGSECPHPHHPRPGCPLVIFHLGLPREGAGGSPGLGEIPAPLTLCRVLPTAPRASLGIPTCRCPPQGLFCEGLGCSGGSRGFRIRQEQRGRAQPTM